MNKIFLYAYDQINLGDDLFVHTIANRYPNVKFYLWSPAVNKTTFSELKNLFVIDQNSFMIKILNKIRPSLAAKYKARKEMACDAVVYIGGSIFIEYTNWQKILTWWEYEAMNRNFYVLGANFGPYHTEEYRKSCARIFANMKDVCLRDKYSQSLFSDVDTVRFAPDILFSCPMKNILSGVKQVFVSVIDCASKGEGDNKLSGFENAYNESMISMLNGFIARGYKVILASFCKAEGDENAVKTIAAKLPADMTVSVKYNGTNLQEILDRISESSFVVASRFHAAILGFTAGKPVLPVVYSDKTIHVLEDVGFTGEYIDIRYLKGIELDSIIANAHVQRLAGIDSIKKQAESHFVKLDILLKRE